MAKRVAKSPNRFATRSPFAECDEAREPDCRTREFDALHAKMQTQKAREAVDALFSATDAELNNRDR